MVDSTLAPLRDGSAARLTAPELETAIARGERLVVLDVRRRDAWTSDPGRIPGAVWIPLDEVPGLARQLPRDLPLVVYCS
ncbi:MAG: rhodanese-like domain-containing protein [Candidatus Rokuibacteriota bacterium]